MANLLAIETTTTGGSLAAFTDGRLLAQRVLRDDQRSAQSLAPALAALWEEVHWSPRDVQQIAVAVGPGSFTGLRVGVTTAKTLAYATGAKIVGIHTLQAIAHQAPPEVPQLWAIVDAFRGQVFAAQYHRDATGAMQPLTETLTLDDEAWVARLSPGDHISGPGLTKIPQLPPGVLSLPQPLWQPRAKSIGELAHPRFATGATDDLWTLAPHYHRPSAAEEKAAAKDAGPG